MERVKISREEQALLKRISASRISDYPSDLPGSYLPQLMAQVLVSTQRCLDRPPGNPSERINPQAECYSSGVRFHNQPSKENLEGLLVSVLRRARKEWCPLPLASMRDTPSRSSNGVTLKFKLSCPAPRGKRFLKALCKYLLRAQDLAIRSGIGIIFYAEKGPVEICGEDVVVGMSLSVVLSSFLPPSLDRPSIEDFLHYAGPLTSLAHPSTVEIMTDRSGGLPICRDSFGMEEDEIVLRAVSPDPEEGIKRALATTGDYCDFSAAVLALDSLSSLISTLTKREYYPYPL